VIAGQEGLGGELEQKAIFVRVLLSVPGSVLLQLLVLLRQQEVPARLLLGLCGVKLTEVRG